MTTFTRTERLVQMANQIGTFFEAMPNDEEALDGIAQHIRRYWEPGMRRELIQASEDTSRQEMNEIVRRSLERYRGYLVDQPDAR